MAIMSLLLTSPLKLSVKRHIMFYNYIVIVTNYPCMFANNYMHTSGIILFWHCWLSHCKTQLKINDDVVLLITINYHWWQCVHKDQHDFHIIVMLNESVPICSIHCCFQLLRNQLRVDWVCQKMHWFCRKSTLFDRLWLKQFG